MVINFEQSTRSVCGAQAYSSRSGGVRSCLANGWPFRSIAVAVEAGLDAVDFVASDWDIAC